MLLLFLFDSFEHHFLFTISDFCRSMMKSNATWNMHLLFPKRKRRNRIEKESFDDSQDMSMRGISLRGTKSSPLTTATEDSKKTSFLLSPTNSIFGPCVRRNWFWLIFGHRDDALIFLYYFS